MVLWRLEGQDPPPRREKKLHALTEEIFCCVSFVICILWEMIDLLAETFEVPWKTRAERMLETSEFPGAQHPLASC